MAVTLGQSVLVENVTGAGGTTGTIRGAQAKADGHTIMMGTWGRMARHRRSIRNLKYDPAKDFAPIGLVAATPILIVAMKHFPADTLNDHGLREEPPR
jgi:tripartite-type tricarboxylate transporter receptor subunit TctC